MWTRCAPTLCPYATSGSALGEYFPGEHGDAQSDGYRYASHYLDGEPRPTAIFAAGDFLAAGVYQAAYARGLHVPDEISIVGYDDTLALSGAAADHRGRAHAGTGQGGQRTGHRRGGGHRQRRQACATIDMSTRHTTHRTDVDRTASLAREAGQWHCAECPARSETTLGNSGLSLPAIPGGSPLSV